MENIVDQEVEQTDVRRTQEENREFARQQYLFLKEKLLKKESYNAMRLSRIFKAAGPGQISEAWNLAACVDWEDLVRKDTLCCLLIGGFGSSVSLRLNWDQMSAVLEDNGFYLPEAFNARCFFRVLEGALEILKPNSYPFSEAELLEMGRINKTNKSKAGRNTNDDK